MKKNYDVIIIGSGPAGLSLACSLSKLDLQIAVLEKNPIEKIANPEIDGRDIALTHYSEILLQKMGVWKHIPPEEISTIKQAKVINGNSPYALNFDYKETDKDYLGRLIPNFLIRAALYKSVKKLKNITLLGNSLVTDISADDYSASITLKDQETLSASLIVAADSRLSNARRVMGIPTEMKDFGRTVIVCEMTHEKEHENIAFECFHYDQTLAVLPLNGKKSSVVITLPTDKLKTLLEMKEEQFNEDISERFGHRLGDMKLFGKRHSYPLIAIYADRFISKRFALLGDAAVGMHPVTAHGFNLGLKGQDILKDELEKAMRNGIDIGSLSILQNFQRRYRSATKPLYLGTNAIVDLYTKETGTAKLARRALLRLGNKLKPARKLIIEQLTETKTS
jgi:ubiquinone biosynthesis UbiH/UbiF/VisC/COQ6 family hydroxylase